MGCGSLSPFLSGCLACVPIAFFPDGKLFVCTPDFAMRSSDDGEIAGVAVDSPPSLIMTAGLMVDEGEGAGEAVGAPPSLIATAGLTVDEGEGEGEAVDVTVFS